MNTPILDQAKMVPSGKTAWIERHRRDLEAIDKACVLLRTAVSGFDNSFVSNEVKSLVEKREQDLTELLQKVFQK